MSGLPIGFMLGNVGRDESDVEADYLDSVREPDDAATTADHAFLVALGTKVGSAQNQHRFSLRLAERHTR